MAKDAGLTGKQHAAVLLAGRERDTDDDGTVVLSGRCGECGYLLTSPGHKVTCE